MLCWTAGSCEYYRACGEPRYPRASLPHCAHAVLGERLHCAWRSRLYKRPTTLGVTSSTIAHWCCWLACMFTHYHSGLVAFCLVPSMSSHASLLLLASTFVRLVSLLMMNCYATRGCERVECAHYNIVPRIVSMTLNSTCGQLSLGTGMHLVAGVVLVGFQDAVSRWSGCMLIACLKWTALVDHVLSLPLSPEAGPALGA